ncbi:MAG: RidA family protein [Dysgonamonadaceae bacterium]|jgi:2-iminobutanoate/2-iminopropanoate deaminase|nr:RidA family protein [Dysgonamonadaceae bacterium]
MKRIINTDKAPAAVGAYSQAVEVNNTLYISGQIPIDPKTGKFVSNTDVKEQARQVLKNVGQILDAAGYSFGDVVKSTVLLRNISDFAAVNEVYATFYTESLPARAAFEVANLPLGALVEIETIAAK